MKEIKGKVKRAVQILWENKYRMAYYMLILCILFGSIHYVESGIWSSANISFNYSEASLCLVEPCFQLFICVRRDVPALA